jgi:crotonobetainyl-CoA:carnitine CoA-transferase CaiB-like acyl-CoA transferase
VRVVEQGTFITGPAASMLLADLGADVVKVEQPAGDPFRAFRGGLYSPHYQTYNRNKKSVTLDTREPADLALFDGLIREADVYIQNFRPGVAEKLGAGEARLRELNPRLVYCAISGFGPDGPAAARPSYDTVAQAASGFLKLLVNPANPRVVGPAIADALTGFYAAYGILGALLERETQQTGRGRRVEVSMFEAMTHFNLDAFTHLFSEGEVMGPFSRPSVSQSYVLPCADGKWIALHMSSPPKFWQGLARAAGRPDLIEDPRFKARTDRRRNYDALHAELAPIFATQPRAHWLARLEAEEVPHGPMYDVREVFDDPHIQHMGMQIAIERPGRPTIRTVRSPLDYSDTPQPHPAPPPELGEHTEAVLSRAGYDAEAIAGFREQGIIP